MQLCILNIFKKSQRECYSNDDKSEKLDLYVYIYISKLNVTKKGKVG